MHRIFVILRTYIYVMQQLVKIAFIINPHSGTSDKHELPDIIKKSLSAEKFDILTVFTEYAGHGRELAAQFAQEGYDAVIACGGDGTVNEVASSLTDTNTAFGIIPFGSGNGLARHLGIPLNVKGALQMISEFPTMQIDYGKMNDHKFFCSCGSGFDAQISFDFANQGTRGLATYIKVILQDYWKYTPKPYKLTFPDGKEQTFNAFLVTFANADQYGNDAFIAPNASIHDGLLDVAVIHDLSLLRVPKLAFQLMTKKLDHNVNVDYYRAQSVQFLREEDGPFHIDGDPLTEGKEINISIVANGLKVIAKSAQ